jgi:hypothetical protein
MRRPIGTESVSKSECTTMHRLRSRDRDVRSGLRGEAFELLPRDAGASHPIHFNHRVTFRYPFRVSGLAAAGHVTVSGDSVVTVAIATADAGISAASRARVGRQSVQLTHHSHGNLLQMDKSLCGQCCIACAATTRTATCSLTGRRRHAACATTSRMQEGKQLAPNRVLTHVRSDQGCEGK